MLSTIRIIYKSVKPDLYFPNGVQVLYRDYAADEVIIIEPVDKESAASSFGKLVGLEPRKHSSRFYPDEKTYPSRPVAGFFFLHGIPSLKKRERLPAAPFHAKTDEVFGDLMTAVKSHWNVGTEIRKLTK
jgi:hypothetical protein